MNRQNIVNVRLSDFEDRVVKLMAKREEVKTSEFLRGLIRNAAVSRGLLPTVYSQTGGANEPPKR